MMRGLVGFLVGGGRGKDLRRHVHVQLAHLIDKGAVWQLLAGPVDGATTWCLETAVSRFSNAAEQ